MERIKNWKQFNENSSCCEECGEKECKCENCEECGEKECKCEED